MDAAGALPRKIHRELPRVGRRRRQEIVLGHDQLHAVERVGQHRGGVVGDGDVDDDGKLKLVLPTLATFAKEETGDVEVHPGYHAKKDTEIVMRRISRERTYGLGERVSFTVPEFSEIAHSCWLLSQDLLDKLPHPSKTAKAG